MHFGRYTAAILGLVLTPLAWSQSGKSTVSDAQIQADVLKSLAADSSLQNQDIQASVAFGTVTLNGSVTDENARKAAETAAANAPNVRKVVDSLTVDAAAVQAAQAQQDAGASAIADAQNEPAEMQQGQQYPQVQEDPQMAQQGQTQMDQQGYPATQGYPQTQQGPQGYPAPPRGPYQRRIYGPYPYPGAPPQQQGQSPNYGQQQGYPQQAYQSGQQAGRQVSVPAGTVLQVRVNQPLDTKNSQPGMGFDGTVLADVVAEGAIAIPRGATVHGQVADVQSAGTLKGRGSLVLELTGVSLGGQEFPVVSEPWVRNGHDKSLQTVNTTIGGGALGAIIGGVAGGGAGAAIGAAVGGAAGLGASAASGGGNVLVPPEAVLQFRISQPVNVATVGQDELNRLAYGSGSRMGPPVLRPRGYGYPGAYPPYFGGPTVVIGGGPYYYGGYYRPYPYYRGYRRW